MIRTAIVFVLDQLQFLLLSFSSFNFLGSLLVFAYMKSPAFENQLIEQVMKHMDWIVAGELENKSKKLKPRSVPDPNDPNKWFWDYIEERKNKQIEEQLNWSN